MGGSGNGPYNLKTFTAWCSSPSPQERWPLRATRGASLQAPEEPSKGEPRQSNTAY